VKLHVVASLVLVAAVLAAAPRTAAGKDREDEIKSISAARKYSKEKDRVLDMSLKERVQRRKEVEAERLDRTFARERKNFLKRWDAMARKQNMKAADALKFRQILQERVKEMQKEVATLADEYGTVMDEKILEVQVRRQKGVSRQLTRLSRKSNLKKQVDRLYLDEFRERYASLIGSSDELKKAADEKMVEIFKTADEEMSGLVKRVLAGEGFDEKPKEETAAAETEPAEADEPPKLDDLIAKLKEKDRASVERMKEARQAEVARRMTLEKERIAAETAAAVEAAETEENNRVRTRMAALKREKPKNFATAVAALVQEKRANVERRKAEIEAAGRQKLVERQAAAERDMLDAIEARVRELAGTETQP
jgi:hypothetical protein